MNFTKFNLIYLILIFLEIYSDLKKSNEKDDQEGNNIKHDLNGDPIKIEKPKIIPKKNCCN